MKKIYFATFRERLAVFGFMIKNGWTPGKFPEFLKAIGIETPVSLFLDHIENKHSPYSNNQKAFWCRMHNNNKTCKMHLVKKSGIFITTGNVTKMYQIVANGYHTEYYDYESAAVKNTPGANLFAIKLNKHVGEEVIISSISVQFGGVSCYSDNKISIEYVKKSDDKIAESMIFWVSSKKSNFRETILEKEYTSIGNVLSSFNPNEALVHLKNFFKDAEVTLKEHHKC